MSRSSSLMALLVLSFGCTTAVADWYSVVQDAGPYAWWQLNETAGITAADAMGNYDGTYKNGPTLGVAGPRPPTFIYMPQDEYAVNFVRTTTNTDHVILSGLGSFGSNMAATGFTYEGWLRTESSLDAMFFGMQATSPNQSQFIQFRLATGGGIDVRLRDSSNKDFRRVVPASNINAVTGGTSGISDNEWHHLGVIFDIPNDSIRVVLDGIEYGGSFTNTYDKTSLVDFTFSAIGAHSNSSGGGAAGFDGDIAQTVLYNKVLTVEQLQAHYQAAIPEPGTLLLLAVGGVAMLLARRRRC